MKIHPKDQQLLDTCNFSIVCILFHSVNKRIMKIIGREHDWLEDVKHGPKF